MRRANTTFVNLRQALDDLDPLVRESKPVAKKLRPFLRELRPLARDARPTLRDLSRLVRTSGADNDLIELTKAAVPLNAVATKSADRNGASREGAFPATVKALKGATPELGLRPGRTPSSSRAGSTTSVTRASTTLSAAPAGRACTSNLSRSSAGSCSSIPPELRQQAFKAGAQVGQLNRCPGSLERGGIWKPTPDYNCDESQVPPGP